MCHTCCGHQLSFGGTEDFPSVAYYQYFFHAHWMGIPFLPLGGRGQGLGFCWECLGLQAIHCKVADFLLSHPKFELSSWVLVVFFLSPTFWVYSFSPTFSSVVASVASSTFCCKITPSDLTVLEDLR